MDYAFLSKEGRGAQVVMEKAKDSRGSTCAGDAGDVFTRRMLPLPNWFLYAIETFAWARRDNLK